MPAIGRPSAPIRCTLLEGLPAKAIGKASAQFAHKPLPEHPDPFGNIEGGACRAVHSAKLATAGERHRIEIKGKLQARRFPEVFESLAYSVGRREQLLEKENASQE